MDPLLLLYVNVQVTWNTTVEAVGHMFRGFFTL